MNLSIVCWFRTYAVPGILYYIAKLGGSRILHPLKLATVFLAILQSHIVLLNCDVCSSFPLPDMLGKLPSNWSILSLHFIMFGWHYQFGDDRDLRCATLTTSTASVIIEYHKLELCCL
jgi:hypothetical protein